MAVGLFDAVQQRVRCAAIHYRSRHLQRADSIGRFSARGPDFNSSAQCESDRTSDTRRWSSVASEQGGYANYGWRTHFSGYHGKHAVVVRSDQSLRLGFTPVTLAFGAVGWVDDYRKVFRKNAIGLPARWKYFWQSLIGVAAAVILYKSALGPAETQYILPFFKSVALDLGLFYIVISYFFIVGFSNAVNLTDGLDGLAILPSVLVGGALGVIAYLAGHVEFANYLQIPYVAGSGEVVIFAGGLLGAGLGFLWFNTYPAQIFMGDVGALALGAALGTMAIIARHELVLVIMGGVFVMETLSVILQVGSFKLTGKRIFKMAPIHHHFELMGWPEPRVIVRFWIITVMLVLFGLATLKLR